MECLDVFCHVLPKPYLDAVSRVCGRRPHMLDRAAAMPVLTEVEARLRVMDQFDGYCQVPSLVSPPLEALAGPQDSPDLARIANDAMAEMTAAHPDRLPGFVAALPMNAPDAAMAEAERAVRILGAVGVQVFTDVNGHPLDAAYPLDLIGLMAGLDRPLWLHPCRGMRPPDYAGEEVSRFELWWALAWPYQTSLAMARLVFAGVFDRWPNVKIIAHHVGGMIPMVEGRLGAGLDLLGSRTPPEHRGAVETTLKGRPLEAFRRFYADTASFGARAPIECGLAFSGPDRLLFGSDMPFDPEGGPGYIRETLRAIGEMNLSECERYAILVGNARRLLRLQKHVPH